jgi:hypothetical protein
MTPLQLRRPPRHAARQGSSAATSCPSRAAARRIVRCRRSRDEAPALLTLWGVHARSDLEVLWAGVVCSPRAAPQSNEEPHANRDHDRDRDGHDDPICRTRSPSTTLAVGEGKQSVHAVTSTKPSPLRWQRLSGCGCWSGDGRLGARHPRDGGAGAPRRWCGDEPDWPPPPLVDRGVDGSICT